MNDYAKQGATENFNKLHDEWRKSLDGWKKIEKKGDVIIKADKLVKRLQQPSTNGQIFHRDNLKMASIDMS